MHQCPCQQFIFLCNWVKSHCVYELYFCYPLIYGWASRLVAYACYCEWWSNKIDIRCPYPYDFEKPLGWFPYGHTSLHPCDQQIQIPLCPHLLVFVVYCLHFYSSDGYDSQSGSLCLSLTTEAAEDFLSYFVSFCFLCWELLISLAHVLIGSF